MLHCLWKGTSLLTFQGRVKSHHSVILARTCNRKRGQWSFSAPFYVLSKDKEESQSMYAGNENIAPSMNYLETTTVAFPSSPELALTIHRLQEGYMAPSKGNISRWALHGRIPAEDVVAFWTRLPWTSGLLWPALRVGKELCTQAWPSTKKDPMALFLRRKMFGFCVFNIWKWKLEANDLTL